MSLNLNYYSDNGRVTTGNDLGPQHDMPMTQRDCNNFYFGQSPMGYYLDLGAQPIAGRPVWKAFRVGDCTKTTPSNYRQPGKWDCRQPCWNPQCK